ncbi:hypothetical protein ACHAXA_009436 [Cyclostephanos tholiformis]|uniref:Uncharacterized protein n=1 Tax=Cyclostephanos tholiformis TaxID=382380 RepID=A0ABD3RK14_9STRA
MPPPTKKFEFSTMPTTTVTKKSPCGAPPPAKKAERAQAGRTKAKHPTPLGGSGEGNPSMRSEARARARKRAREWARNTLSSMKGASTPPRTRGAIDDDDDDDDGHDEEGRGKDVVGSSLITHDGVAMEGRVEGRQVARLATTEGGTPAPQGTIISRHDVEGIFTTPKDETTHIHDTRIRASDESIGNEEDVFYDALECPLSTMVGRHIDAIDIPDEEDVRLTARREKRWNPEPLEPGGISFSTFVPKPDP